MNHVEKRKNLFLQREASSFNKIYLRFLAGLLELLRSSQGLVKTVSFVKKNYVKN